jgi:cell division protein FtsQ
VRLLPQLMTNPERRIERADLRYTNGFALVWAKNATTDVSMPNAVAPATPRVAGRSVQRVVAAAVHSPTATAYARAVVSPFPIPGLS